MLQHVKTIFLLHITAMYTTLCNLIVEFNLRINKKQAVMTVYMQGVLPSELTPKINNYTNYTTQESRSGVLLRECTQSVVYISDTYNVYMQCLYNFLN